MESNVLPDIQAERTSQNSTIHFSRIQKVGMSELEIPIHWRGQLLAGRADVYVNLREGESRGIHMSRLYSLILDQLGNHELKLNLLSKMGRDLIHSQEGLSNQSCLEIKFSLPLETMALKSGQKGFRSYPFNIKIETSTHEQSIKIGFEILYSSTCPQSTALSLEVWKAEAQRHGSLEWIENLQSMPATPHAQRSKAQFLIEIKRSTDVTFDNWILLAEKCLATPVQTIVKRIDEQEFAKLNGANTMFCEDSARRIESWLKSHSDVLGYWARVEHQESLHPHNAVAEISS